MTKNQIIVETSSIIERWRTELDLIDAMRTFVFYWANMNTGIHNVSSALLDDNQYLEDCANLTVILSSQMLRGQSCALENLMKETGVVDVAKPLATVNQENGEMLSMMMGYTGTDQYFPYSQCGGQAMDKMEQICAATEFSDLDNPLQDFNFILEEPNPLMCAASIIQIFNKLEYLSRQYEKGIIPKTLNVINIEVLTRLKGSHDYITKSMVHSSEVATGLQRMPTQLINTIH
ncbi:hypothetical protein J4N45_10100 [Vibrio sp. SCSIO 43140]|uniref:hypothetical protein n=1 Tax=Vibrio sp. SCSIO 43140 TaxID=2819100 RepID=UPI0020762C6B|nr:hypothetical protein [Vibrio sp. SCSIO 43140]USD58881.1 hypothetical protein J4N45_10100 [Vibrio sp. SCSIO 43140]